jgi:hypothetical protein
MKKNLFFRKTLKNYINYLKKNKLFKRKQLFFYENNIEKIENWTNSDFKSKLLWYHQIKKKK